MDRRKRCNMVKIKYEELMVYKVKDILNEENPTNDCYLEFDPLEKINREVHLFVNNKIYDISLKTGEITNIRLKQ